MGSLGSATVPKLAILPVTWAPTSTACTGSSVPVAVIVEIKSPLDDLRRAEMGGRLGGIAVHDIDRAGGHGRQRRQMLQ